MPDRSAPLPDLDAIRLLALVADTGSIGGAARRDGISQPSASKRIAVLERRLGLRLLRRRTTGSELTDHGRLVTEWAREVLRATDALLAGAAALRTAGSETVRVAASQTVAEYLMPLWLAELRTVESGARVRLEVMNSTGVVAAVVAGDCDLGYIESPGVPKGLTTSTVRDDELLLVAAPGHPFTRRRTPVTAADLLGTALVVREQGSGTREVLERAVGTLELADVLELDSNAAVKIAVAAGAGATVISRLAVAAELTRGSLVQIRTDGLDLRRQLRMVSRRGARPSPAAAALAQLSHRR
ncbi:LysR family transcriptional regulator [Nakamurella lactea]|uniref:LysR family transcriptional regulator n=1 Tax=Nakamurella lactea TaxID=459515 RepID=UPI00041708AC|nr:LysR family transcriptional regulator [Nakamurella lactea]